MVDVVIFAAGFGSRLGLNIPKCLVNVNGQYIIDHEINFIASTLPDCQIHVVAGFQYKKVKNHLEQHHPQINLIFNPFFKCAGINGSAWLSLPHVTSEIVWRINGDIIMLDPAPIHQAIEQRITTFIQNDCPYIKDAIILESEQNKLQRITPIDRYEGTNEWCGFEIYFNNEYQKVVSCSPLFIQGSYYDAVNHSILNEMIPKPSIGISSSNYEIDTLADLQQVQTALS